MRAVLVRVLVLTLAVGLGIAPAAAQQPLPPGVVARVYGRDITEQTLADRLARSYEGTERGRGILTVMVEDLCVALEAERRAVTVSEAEIQAYMKRWDERIKKQSNGKASLRDLYEGPAEEREFIDTAREYMLRQKMAREDLGARGTDDLPEHRLKLWMAALRRRLDVRYTGLPEGVLAMVGERLVRRRAFADTLREKLPVEMVNAVRNELVLAAAAENRLREAGIVVTDEDLEAALTDMRTRFAEDPRVKGSGLTFDEFLRQSRGLGEDDLRSDPVFRARIGLRRLLAAGVTDEDVRRHWEENRAVYGERALVRQIYLPAADGGGEFDLPTFSEAWERAQQAKVDVLQATGIHLPKESRPGKPLGPIVTEVAKAFEKDGDKRKRAGEPTVWTRLAVEGEEALEKAAFDGPKGVLQGPIRSSVGFHLVVVEERRPAPRFEEITSHIRDDLVQKAIQDFQLEARDDPNVIFAE